MKYRLICFLIFASLLVACEKDPIDTKGNAISFNNSPARAAVVPNEQNGLVDNARVWGYYVNNSETTWVWGNATAGEKANLEITTDENNNLTGGLIINGNTKYWFGGEYDFFSIYSEKCINGALEPTFSGGKLSFDYNISDQKELRYACHLNTEGTTTRTDKVDFDYQHLLSKIKFQGFSTDANNSITVTKVEISSIPQQATVSLNIAGVTATDVKLLTASYTKKTGTATGLSTSNASGWECNSTDGYVVFEKMVFPQTVAKDAIQITVTYNTSSETGKTKSAYLPTSTWEAGKSYIYNFKIQPSGPIIFDEEVIINDWDKAVEAGDVQF
ncbi:MAG: fimbrillin family protein [Paludibacteraceae bacterium]|nr:fimbrillin family protein [Paludibacteraceae bacterium]